MADVPAAIADILRGRNMAAQIHIPPDSELGSLDLPNVEKKREPPGQFDAALTVAPFAIAETGTLAYTAGTGAPASWHFRPVLEIAILRASFDRRRTGRRAGRPARRPALDAEPRHRSVAHRRHRADDGARAPTGPRRWRCWW